VRFAAKDIVLSDRICVGSSDTVLSARPCRVVIGVSCIVDARDTLGLLDVESPRFLPPFGPKGVATLPRTPVTPPNRAFPPPATSFGAFVSTSIMPLPIVSNA